MENFWEYSVDSSGGPDYTLRRRVMDVALVDGLDYYLVGQNRGLGQPYDSLNYLRNLDNLGTVTIDHPLGSDPRPDTLFKYPAVHLQDYWTVEGDCVLVIIANPISIVINGTTYSGVIAFQRFFDAQHSVQYFIKPYVIGILREDEYVGANRVARRDITQYFVQNDL